MIYGGKGCGELSIPKEHCKHAAATLGYNNSNPYRIYEEEDKKCNQPYGCFVGHSHTNWAYTYYNNYNKNGCENDDFRSICKKHVRKYLFRPKEKNIPC